MQSISIDTLSQILDFDAEVGKLWWKKRNRCFFNSDRAFNAWNAKFDGKPALNSINPVSGYAQGRIFRRIHLAHRVIFALHYGHWPLNEIDHINGISGDNRICNLRDVTHQDNCKNWPKSSRNKSGVTGVHFCNSSNKWISRIKISGELKYLGSFSNIKDAAGARKKAEIAHGFHPNHGRTPQ